MGVVRKWTERAGPPSYRNTRRIEACGKISIFVAPTPVLIGISIHLPEQHVGNHYNATEEVCHIKLNRPRGTLYPGRYAVCAGHYKASRIITPTVISTQWQIVDIMKAGIVGRASQQEADVFHRATIERQPFRLLRNNNVVGNSRIFQELLDVGQELPKMLFSVSIRHNNF